MPLSRLKRLALTGALCLGMIGATFTMRPAGASDTIECNPECSWVCDGGAGPCMETQCCTVDQLPCDEDDVESITCKGDPEIVITPE